MTKIFTKYQGIVFLYVPVTVHEMQVLLSAQIQDLAQTCSSTTVCSPQCVSMCPLRYKDSSMQALQQYECMCRIGRHNVLCTMYGTEPTNDTPVD